jgi:short-subunit dehydrogenase
MTLTDTQAEKEQRRLAGQVAIVTGGSKGLGLLVAREFARLGAAVTICSRHDDELVEARQWLAEQGVEVETAVCDVGKKDEAESLIRGVEERAGRIDFLVNNAGVIQVGPLDALALEDFEQAIDIMFWGTVVPSLAVLPGMKARRSGRIINITSLGGKVSVPHLLPYSTAKFAGVGFSEGLRAELAGSGVGVVTVVPGLIRTGSFVNALFKGNQQKEFSWFSILSSLPLLSIDAEKAATRVVKAALRNEPELILSLPANAAVRTAGMAPGLLSYVLGLTARVLPSSPVSTPTASVPGSALDSAETSSVSKGVKTLGNKARKSIQPPFHRAA